MSNSLKKKPPFQRLHFLSALLHHTQPFASMAQCANSLPQVCLHSIPPLAQVLLLLGMWNYQEHSHTMNTVLNNNHSSRRNAQQEKKLQLFLWYDYKVQIPMWTQKNDASVLPTTDEATISTNHQCTGSSVSGTIGYVLYYIIFFHYCFNLLGTGLCIIPSHGLPWLHVALSFFFLCQNNHEL